MLGMEAAVFVPSGTLCNEIALRVHCAPVSRTRSSRLSVGVRATGQHQPTTSDLEHWTPSQGDEVVCDETAHIVNAEGGAPAALAGVMLRCIKGPRGIMTTDQLRAGIRNTDAMSNGVGLGDFSRRYPPACTLLHLENTSNGGGGTPWPLDHLADVIAIARERGVAVHMDGARLANAAVALGVPLAAVCKGVDSVGANLLANQHCGTCLPPGCSRDQSVFCGGADLRLNLDMAVDMCMCMGMGIGMRAGLGMAGLARFLERTGSPRRRRPGRLKIFHR